MLWMNVANPLAGAAAAPIAAFDVLRAGDEGAPPTPLVFASPHSGRVYPEDMMRAAALDAVSIRRSEDAFVDDLIASAVGHGAALITARVARAYIDLNREPFELDASMFADELPAFARARTARVAAGLGAIAKVVSEGQEIYAASSPSPRRAPASTAPMRPTTRRCRR
jgi:N-formylglutamate amidohydrolase